MKIQVDMTIDRKVLSVKIETLEKMAKKIREMA